jgi:hypothetical protein
MIRHLTEYAIYLVGSTEITMTCLPDYGFIGLPVEILKSYARRQDK